MADEVLGSRAIVTGEKNQCVLAQPELIDAIEELAHMLIQCLHHFCVAHVASMGAMGWVRVEVVRDGVAQRHGVVGKKGPLLVALHEVE